MPYKLVEGEVRLYYKSTRLVGSRPDGDSAWFLPDNPSLLSDIGGRSAKFNKGDFAQLRFEGIDALELHFPGGDHQLAAATVNARDFLLASLGFDLASIEYAPNDDIPTAIRETKPISVRASIMTRSIDPFGRPVAFVFPGNAPERSGSEVFLKAARLDQSLNAALMRAGHVYPAYYSGRLDRGTRVGGLPGDLRKHLTSLAVTASNNNAGLWPSDKSLTATKITQYSDLSQLAIWPKLYRRLAKYFNDNSANHSTLTGFRDWLQANRTSRDDIILVLSIGELLNLSDILTFKNSTIRMKFPSQDLVIVPR